RGVPLAHAPREPLHDPAVGRQSADRAAPRGTGMEAAPRRGGRGMTSSPAPKDVLLLESTDELRDWFDANHETAEELWLGYHKKDTGRPTTTSADATDEGLCLGG